MSFLIKTGQTLAAPTKGKSSLVDFIVDNDGGSPLYAAWLHCRETSRLADRNPFLDVSNNGRTLTQTGADAAQSGQLADGFYGRNDRWLNPPFTQADWFAAGVAGEITFIQFLLMKGTDVWNMVSPASGAANEARVSMQSTGVYDSLQTLYYGTGNAQAVQGNPISAARATDIYMAGGTSKLSGASAFSAFGDAQPNLNAITPANQAGGAVGGPAMRLCSRSTAALDGSRAVLSMAFDRVLTIEEIRIVQLGAIDMLEYNAIL